jgi:hypothetical protein
MNTFTKITGAVMRYDKALPAIQEANAAIDAAERVLGTIELERDALVESAMLAEPSEAAKLTKAAEALRHKRLSALLAMARIPHLKDAAQTAIRTAAAEDADTHASALKTHEAQLNEAARLAGYQPGSRQWLLMFSNDGTLAAVKRFVTEAKAASLNFRAATPEDGDAMAEVQRQIRSMLA